ncbi:hypothetical protein F5J12DRAFT_432588 [Pisolithus orientalis]|uniref:uncharacterized protein n=1 Tax=Pisolithus orientalis TaxID=936130 RepID=UPI00222493EE|nr:uncharacterized protein F5J12DRAFT_432588 [Pisolithus orientalis]KAI5993059.1 hypothetical protein F5J12DRAFT_432588 [Pisolithus orientalis]
MATFVTQPYSMPQTSSAPSRREPEQQFAPDDDAGKKKKTKRRKVNHACLYCRRSHMTCDEGRPCQRCIKREIGHLCHDEQRPPKATAKPEAVTPTSTEPSQPPQSVYPSPAIPQSTSTSWSMNVPQNTFLYQPETLGNEFSVLTDFLETLDDGSFFTPPPRAVTPSLSSFPNTSPETMSSAYVTTAPPPADNATNPAPPPDPLKEEEPVPPLLPSATKAEKFLLTAADQEPGTRDERLNRVIQSKYEAGLLKPYDYVKGYARLSVWMDRNVSKQSKQQILQPLSILRPKFRAVAQSLRDIDLVFIEEAFERLLLDYDRVFSAMGVPACLWRRTGEIYKGNREFSELVGVDGYMMRDGRLCIYELMAEESAVNYWEKYGHVAFDTTQKAVLTSCVLRYKPVINTHSSKRKKNDEDGPSEEGHVNCCFSFTIRRDKWGIPTMIVGNFIKC